MGQPVVHFEIGCRDKERAAAFYQELFGWQTHPAGPATLIDTGAGTGINGHFTALGHEPHHYVLVYIQVEAIAPYLERIEALGGGVVVPAVPLPDGRQFAWLTDPDGNTFGVITPLTQKPEAAEGEPVYFKGAFPISGDVGNIPVRELAPAIAFYTHLLGFQVVSREEKRAVLRRDDAEIGLACTQEDPEQVSVYFGVQNLEALHGELTSAGLEPTDIRPSEHAGNQYRVCFAKEPYGVCFCFGEPA